MKTTSKYFPAKQLSIAGNRDEFCIPASELGDAICSCHLVWGKVKGEIQPCILHPGVHYPDFQPASAKEVYND